MNTRTLLIVLAVVAVAFVATNCLAATVDANKPCDANKPADVNKPGKTTASVVDFSKYTEEGKDKGKGCDKDKDPNKGKGCDKDPNKATIISASDFGMYAAEANKPAEKGKGHHHKRDPNNVEPKKPAEPNKATIISASDFGTLAKKADPNKPADVNKPAEPNKSKLCAVSEKNADTLEQPGTSASRTRFAATRGQRDSPSAPSPDLTPMGFQSK